ncbi:MAG: amylo-alpha-1,6-glucosidase [Prevotellaceae bacterium]|jgi:predicted glycogen debranching enzyme|nr:amylo-alpha-1,6-glucosidase [Prevotellaceae bacterium]
MSYLKFDRVLLTNLEQSLNKEFLRTNMSGAYASSSIIDCNTRKYHGLLVVPIPEIDRDNHVLLSSLDETVIQHNAEFNLGIHNYRDNYFSPKGHKYIREFHIDGIPTTIYRIGGVILKKERIFKVNEDKILIRYTLLEAHSPTTLRLKPFLAFRSVNNITYENNAINTDYQEVNNGVSFCLYKNYPNLVMQTNIKSKFVSSPDWYKGIEYYKEQERGYDYVEDLFVPGYFELNIKKDEPVVFVAGTDGISTKSIKSTFENEVKKVEQGDNFYNCLKNAAKEFYIKKNDDYYMVAAYPWFKFRSRDSLIALPGCSLAIDNKQKFENVIDTFTRAIDDFMSKKEKSTLLREIALPDVLLWYIWNIQQYALFVSMESAAEKFGNIVLNIINFIRNRKHPNLFLQENGLLYTDGKQKPVTWMNAVENDLPITPRSGYVVEINALWYNDLCFAAEIAKIMGNQKQSDMISYRANDTKNSFVRKFWNGTYLFDFVDNGYPDWEVRPNMIFAVSLPHSPLDKKQQKSVVDIVTKELLTVRGLRSLSPKSGMYRPNYIGGHLERNRNYHNGPVWAWILGAYAEAYVKIYRQSGISFLRRIFATFESELKELTVGTLSELYDGNPPFKGHGAMSYAPTVAEILRAMKIIENEELKIEN